MRPWCPKAFRPVAPDRRRGVQKPVARWGMDLTTATRSRGRGIQDQQRARLMGLPDQRHDLGPGTRELGMPDVDPGHQLRTESQQTHDLCAVGTVVRGAGTVGKPVGQQKENIAICHAEVTQLQRLQSSPGPMDGGIRQIQGVPGKRTHTATRRRGGKAGRRRFLRQGESGLPIGAAVPCITGCDSTYSGRDLVPQVPISTRHALQNHTGRDLHPLWQSVLLELSTLNTPPPARTLSPLPPPRLRASV